MNPIDWGTKMNYLKRNPVTVARQIDNLFQELWGKVILSGMHPIGQILNFDDREFQNKGMEQKYAPKIDENNDSEVVEFIDQV